MSSTLHIAPINTSDHRCSCCGEASRTAWGEVRHGDSAHAVYYVHWTIGRVSDHGANFDIILGRWGEGTTSAERYAVSLAYRLFDNGPQFMVIDSADRRVAKSDLVGKGLARVDVIGSPIATEVFAICDAILAEDARVAELWGQHR